MRLVIGREVAHIQPDINNRLVSVWSEYQPKGDFVTLDEQALLQIARAYFRAKRAAWLKDRLRLLNAVLTVSRVM